MALGICYWILMLIWLVFGAYGVLVSPVSADRLRVSPSGVILFLLLLILGWAQFGPPIK